MPAQDGLTLHVLEAELAHVEPPQAGVLLRVRRVVPRVQLVAAEHNDLDHVAALGHLPGQTQLLLHRSGQEEMRAEQAEVRGEGEGEGEEEEVSRRSHAGGNQPRPWRQTIDKELWGLHQEKHGARWNCQLVTQFMFDALLYVVFVICKRIKQNKDTFTIHLQICSENIYREKHLPHCVFYFKS